MMELWDKLFLPEVWQEFLDYKIEKQHISDGEKWELEDYIKQKKYLTVLGEMSEAGYELPLPYKKEINKAGATKKRVVYSYSKDFSMLLKLIAYLLYRYDDFFADNCYAFRRSYGVKDAVKSIRSAKDISQKYCLKVDISNYFNSIDVPMLLEKLSFLKQKDSKLSVVLAKLLTADRAIVSEEGQEQCIVEKRGAMAGTPISPFLANVYLMDVDAFFAEGSVLYFRYSDDILLFADSLQELKMRKKQLYDRLETARLELNPAKVHISMPGDAFEFLGFSFQDGRVDLSAATILKMKGKIKRKAHALRRWQEKKKLPSDRAAKGFIKAMNRKLYDSGDGTEFSWSRWFFPCLTTDNGLKEIDAYMQQYVRYCCTGRHYKGNYRIAYEQIKQWGYKSLVHEYYEYHKL